MKFVEALRRTLTDPQVVLQRPLDASFAIDQAILWNQEHKALAGKINPKKIAVMGHSYGAYTTLALCGARPILDYLKPPVPPGKGLVDNLSDPRITFGFAMSPQASGGTRFNQDSYKTIVRPVVCMTGSEDISQVFQDGKDQGKTMPAASRLEAFRLMPAGMKYLLWLHNADHLCFSDNPKAWILPSASRPDAQRISKAMMVLFCDHFLKQDPSATAYLNTNYANSLCGKVVTKIEWLEKSGEVDRIAKNIPPSALDKALTHNGLKRTYRLYLPPSFDKTKPLPLVIALHGGGGTGKNMERLTRNGFNTLADKEGFVVVYPDGIERHWNDGRKEVSYRAHKEKIDDVGFISTLIDHLSKDANIDPRRVYVTGASNGAMMSYRLACEIPEKITAIAPVMGALPVEFTDAKPSAPMPVLMVSGTADPLVPWAGGNIGFSRNRFRRAKTLGKVMSQKDTVSFWVTHNQCAATPTVTRMPDTDTDDGTQVRREAYAATQDKAEVILYAIEGGGHTWPGGYPYLPDWIIGKTSRDIDANEIIWNFFKRH